MLTLTLFAHSVLILHCLGLAPLAAAHGFVHAVVIDGQTYPGWNPFSDPYASPSPVRVVRKVRDDGFVGSGDTDLACHHQGAVGTGAVAAANAGSSIEFQWSYWPSDHQGPVSTYMTSCNGDCSAFSPDGAKWFKLNAAGYFPSEKRWAADQLRENSNSWSATIPRDLASGQYLVRHEIIALHSGAPQFYPACIQIDVKGSGRWTPTEAELTTFPAVYDGVAWPNIYNDVLDSFLVPGPPPVGSSSGNSPQNDPSSQTIGRSETRVQTSTVSVGSPRTPTPTNIGSQPVPTSADDPSETDESLDAPPGRCRLVPKRRRLFMS